MEEKRTLSRRNILKALSVSSLSVATLSQANIASAKQNLNTTNLNGSEKHHVIDEALSNEDFKSIKKRYNRKGWKFSEKDSQAVLVENQVENLMYRLLVASFESQQNESQQRYILWTDLETADIDMDPEVNQVTGHIFEKKGSNAWKITKSTVQQGYIVTDTQEFEESNTTLTSVNIASNCNSNECYEAKTTCESYNWGCVLKTAGSYVTFAGACASCVFGAASCYYCLGALLTASGVTISCDIGNDCETTYECTTWCDD